MSDIQYNLDAFWNCTAKSTISPPNHPSKPSLECSYSRLHRLPAHALSLLLLLLLLHELPLLLRRHALELGVSCIQFGLVRQCFPLLGSLGLGQLLDLLGFFITGCAHAAHHFGTEVGGGDELVGHAQEVGEDWEGWWSDAAAGGAEAEVEGDALLRDELVEAV